MNEVLISGYYGFKNSGDDALLRAITHDLKHHKPDIQITVLSQNPKETTKLYGVRAIHRLNPVSVVAALLRCKMLISGGGTLIQDGTSTKSLVYYLTILSLAKRFGKKVMLYANGIGPVKPENMLRTKQVLDTVDVITLRDAMSRDTLEEIGVTGPDIRLTADPAFALEAADRTMAENVLRAAGVPARRRILGISVRPWKKLSPDFAESVAKAIDTAVTAYGFYPVFLPMQKQCDTEITKQIIKHMHSDACLLEQDMDISVLLAVFAAMDLCIGMRLHSLIYAAASAVPVIGLVYDPKITGVMEYMQQQRYLPAENLQTDKLSAMIADCMENTQTEQAIRQSNAEILRKKAKENAKLAIELLDKEC